MGKTRTFQEIESLENEIAEQQKKLAQLRRELVGRPIDKDYELIGQSGKVKLSELFGNKQHLVIIHNMGMACPFCTMWADGFNGLYKHVVEGTYTNKPAAFVVVSPDTPAQQSEGKKTRGWTFPMYSNGDSPFTRDMGFQDNKGFGPGCSTFSRDPKGNIRLVSQSSFGPGDPFCSVWHFVDMLD